VATVSGERATSGVAIAGIGETPITKVAPESALELAGVACLGALVDAGLDPGAVDGLLRFGAPFETVTHGELSRLLELGELSFFGEIPLGGEAAAGMVSHAMAAILSGQASTVLCYRSIKQSGGNRFGRADQRLGPGGGIDPDGDLVVGGDAAFTWPYWMMAPAHLFALWATRYMAVHKVSFEDLNRSFASLAITQRAYAASNPRALLRDRPLDEEAFAAGRMISWPLSLFTLCLENDGACAVVVTSQERAADLRQPPVQVLAASQSLAPRREPMSVYADNLIEIFPPEGARRLWARAGVGPRDVDVAELYDATSLMTILSLELYGFVPVGEGWRYVLEKGTGPASPLPVNTHGGHLSEGYVHGMTGLLEAVRQVRGHAVNQVQDVEVAFFGCPSGSAVVLGRS
jgi:acetyl-CoA acetyltransferase